MRLKNPIARANVRPQGRILSRPQPAANRRAADVRKTTLKTTNIPGASARAILSASSAASGTVMNAASTAMTTAGMSQNEPITNHRIASRWTCSATRARAALVTCDPVVLRPQFGQADSSGATGEPQNVQNILSPLQRKCQDAQAALSLAASTQADGSGGPSSRAKNFPAHNEGEAESRPDL